MPLEHALAYAARGWRVIPIPPGFKHPHGIDDWPNKATTDTARIARHWTAHPDHGVGIVTGIASGLVVIDIDSYHPGADDDWHALVAAHSGDLPDTVEALTGRDGRHLYLRHPDDGGPPITNAAHALPPGVDVRGEGGFVVTAPTIHPVTGQAYAWEVMHDPFDGVAVAPMPGWLVGLLRTPAPHQTARTDRPAYAGTDSIIDRFAADHTWPQLLGGAGWTLHSVRHECELWTRPGKEIRDGASASLYYGGTDLLKVFSSDVAPLEHLATYTRFGFWAAMRHSGDHSAAAGDYRRTINATAAEPTRKTTMTTQADPDQDAGAEDGALDGQPHTDLGNARRLVEAHGHDLRHTPQLGAWLAWDGHRWREDVTGEAQRRAKAVVDSMLTEMAMMPYSDKRKELFKHWGRSQSSGRLEAMVHVATTEPGVPVLVAELDADPWTLNTLGGVVDLRSGEVTTADRRALVTKLAPVTPDPAATCPRWLDFLDWAMAGDTELIGFIQRAVGYSLTGVVSEQALFFLHGHGENGKSTFLNVVGRLLGDYSIAAEPDLLLATMGDKHTTGIADLVGRRLVVVQETEEGRRFAESTIKQLTGGDTVRARRMRQDFFEFTPTWKLWMAANHKPMVRGTDHAIWRRIRLIPFEARLAAGQKDDRLLDKLLDELPGILGWALEGCRRWQSDGLAPPSAVIAATAEYRTEQDHTGRFIEDTCTLDADMCVSARELRETYERWCVENGERPWSAKALAPQFTERGCERTQVGSGKVWTWLGITLADQPRPIDFAVAVGRVMRGRSLDTEPARPIRPFINGPRTNAGLPGQTEIAAHTGPSTCSPYAREKNPGDTGNRPRQAAPPPPDLPNNPDDELF